MWARRVWSYSPGMGTDSGVWPYPGSAHDGSVCEMWGPQGSRGDEYGSPCIPSLTPLNRAAECGIQ